MKYDGVGREARNGLNFTERGFGLRGGVGCYDRGHTAIAQVAPGAFDFDRIFRQAGGGVRWFHTGGMFAALSATAAQHAQRAMQSARANGTCVSYDLNYRDSLWRSSGGAMRAREVNRGRLPHVDVLSGNEEDFQRRSASKPRASTRDFPICRSRAFGA